MRIHQFGSLGPAQASTPAQASNPALASGGRLGRAGAALLRLQRSHGNRYVQGLMVGPADDDYEREAERVAVQVTRRPAGHAQDGHPSAGSLPASLKEEFETAFGADFGAVRVHTGDQAVRLSRDLHAAAFTHGSDVFFGVGRYAPRTPAGRRLLAHELTHVVQQGGAPPRRDPGGDTAPVIRPRNRATAPDCVQRMLMWDNTDWTSAEKAWASEGGGLGVVFVTDEPTAPPASYDPVVLKTGEDAPAEVVLAANLHNLSRGGGWRQGAPGVRTVDPAEGREIIKQVGGRVLGGNQPGWQKISSKAMTTIRKADQPGSMVFEYVRGTEFVDLLEQTTKHSEKKVGGGRRLRQDSPARLFKDADFVMSMARFTAIDIFTGNYDRLIRYNPGNFKVDRINRTILLIDNVQLSNEFAFKSFQNARAALTSDAAYHAWAGRAETTMLQTGDFAGIADLMLDSVKQGVVGWNQVRAQDVATVRAALDKTKAWWIEGLVQGKDWLFAANRDLARLTQGVDPADVQEVQASITKRMRFLFPDLRRLAVVED